MKKLTIFYLEHCPYCRNAKKALGELLDEDPDLRNAEIDWIEESRSPEIADRYDYYRVPSIFAGSEKLFECEPGYDFDTIKQHFREALKKGLE